MGTGERCPWSEGRHCKCYEAGGRCCDCSAKKLNVLVVGADPTEAPDWRARALAAEQALARRTEHHDGICDDLANQQTEEIEDLKTALVATQRELERWRHGVTIEGDFVCPDSLALADRDRQIAALRETIEAEVVEQVAAWLEIYADAEIAGRHLVPTDIQRRILEHRQLALLAAVDELRSGAWRKP